MGLSLRWNDFETTTRESLKSLHGQNHLTDVTLISHDDQELEAHKVVLVGASPYFERVLRKNPDQHPLLYLHGVNMKVVQEDLEAFLKGASELEVKGLERENVDTLSENADTATLSENVVAEAGVDEWKPPKDEPLAEGYPETESVNMKAALKQKIRKRQVN